MEPTKEQLEKGREIVLEAVSRYGSERVYPQHFLISQIATALAEAAVPVSEAAEICAEMAREMTTRELQWLDKGEADAARVCGGSAKMLREAERRIRARITTPETKQSTVPKNVAIWGEIWIDAPGAANFKFHIEAGGFQKGRKALAKFATMMQERLESAAQCPFYEEDRLEWDSSDRCPQPLPLPLSPKEQA